MPKVRRHNVPREVMRHLLDRMEEREITVEQLHLFAEWLADEPEAPAGCWFKRFPGMIVCGEGGDGEDLLAPGAGTRGKGSPLANVSPSAPISRTSIYSVLQQCIHCGMCLPACPTYDAMELERHGPRGRIALMRSVADGRLELTEAFGDEMYFCLGCPACETACRAGVTKEPLRLRFSHLPPHLSLNLPNIPLPAQQDFRSASAAASQ